MAEKVRSTFSEIKERYGFNFDLKDEQVELVAAIMSGKDAVGVLPTGFGKSMAYVLPPLILSELKKMSFAALVVSPLVGLSLSQAEKLNGLGILSVVIREYTEAAVKKDILKGKARVIFASPEALFRGNWLRVIASTYAERLCVQVYDEAHCISEWGNDFRPEYKRVCNFRGHLDCPALALTATMTTKIKRDVFNTLCFDEDTIIVSAVPDRPDVFLAGRKSSCRFQDELQWIVEQVQQKGVNALKIIVYTNNILSCSKIFKWMSLSLDGNAFVIDNEGERHRVVEMFHAHLDDNTKKRIIREFTQHGGPIRVLISTVALGMGVEVPDVAAIIQWGLPNSILQYWQQIGRCARCPEAKGVSIFYAYPGSIARCHDFTLRSLLSEENQKCMRKSVLRELCINGENFEVSGRLCNCKCFPRCKCKLCVCCSTCLSLCQCKNKISGDIYSLIGLAECPVQVRV